MIETYKRVILASETYIIGMSLLHYLWINKEKMMSIFIYIFPRRSNNGVSVFCIFIREFFIYSKVNAFKSEFISFLFLSLIIMEIFEM
jgi:hypothetical protein